MDPDRARELLALERARIEKAMAELRGDQPEAIVDEPGDRGSESLYQDEYDADRARDLADELAAVERAEARVAAGTYRALGRKRNADPRRATRGLSNCRRAVEELASAD